MNTSQRFSICRRAETYYLRSLAKGMPILLALHDVSVGSRLLAKHWRCAVVGLVLLCTVRAIHAQSSPTGPFDGS